MTVQWPHELQMLIPEDTYKEAFAKVMIRTTMDTGRPKRRRRFTAAIKTLEFDLIFTGSELDRFIVFFEDEISGGATSFELVHPRTAAICTVAFSKEPDPAMKAGSDIYRVPVNLDILP